MRERLLRRRCRRLLRRLDLTPPLDVDEFCRKLGELRGRPIRAVAHPLVVPGPFGLWISTDDKDFIFYQQETTRAHQEHIILHEIGHIIAEHDSDPMDAERAEELAPTVDPELSRGLFPEQSPPGRWGEDRTTMYDTAEEWEAETVATLIKEWAAVQDRIAVPRSADPALNSITDALCDGGGRL